MLREWQARELICEIGRRMYAKELICANEGNLSIRLGERLIATPTGLCKGDLQPDDLVVTNLEGDQLEGMREVSSEIKMHVVVYRGRPDVGAVCHGHPVYGTAHAVAGIPLREALMPEVVLTLGCVPIAPYELLPRMNWQTASMIWCLSMMRSSWPTTVPLPWEPTSRRPFFGWKYLSILPQFRC